MTKTCLQVERPTHAARESVEWVYEYDSDGNRTGLVPKTPCEPTKKRVKRPTEDALNDAWTYGQPLREVDKKHKPKSYASALVGARWHVAREVTSHIFWKLYREWLHKVGQYGANVDLLYDVLHFDREAKRLGISNHHDYIGERVNRSSRMVQEYLKLIDFDAILQENDAIVSVFGQTSYSIHEGQVDSWYPSKKQIERKMASLPRPCAVVMPNCYDLRYPKKQFSSKLMICPSCHRALSDDDKLMPLWVLGEITRIKRNLYHQAIEQCFYERYGVMSLDEAEDWLDTQ